MTDRHNDQTEFTTEALSEIGISRLLQLGISGPRRPIDRLIERLALHDGEVWFNRSMCLSPLDRLPLNGQGELDLAELREIKDSSKRCFSRPRDPEDRIIGLLGYFLAIATALARHRVNICSRSPAEVERALVDLAAVCPAGWREALSQAAGVAAEMARSDTAK